MEVSIPYGSGYTVDETGAVYSYKKGKRNRLKPLTGGHGGYEKVRLYIGEGTKWKDFFVHRLVAEAFIPNPDNLPVVNHKDQNPGNNAAQNLEWCTIQYNCNYGDAKERMGAAVRRFYEEHPEERERVSRQKKGIPRPDYVKKKVADTLSKPIIAYKNGVETMRFSSGIEAQEVTGTKRSNICKVLHGQRKTAGGFEWKYAEGGEIEAAGITAAQK